MGNIVEGYKKMVNLCDAGNLDKNDYIAILQEMAAFMPTPKAHSGAVFDSLNKMSSADRMYLVDYKDEKLVRLKFGEEYIYRGLWNRFRDDGMGHVSDFSIQNCHFVFTLNLKIGLIKSEEETQEEFDKRNTRYHASFPYEIVEKKLEYHILSTEKNKKMLLDYLAGFLTYGRYILAEEDGYLKEITIWAKDIVPYEKGEKPADWNLSALERIKKECEDAVFACEMGDLVVELDDTIRQIVSSAYYKICCELGYENDYLREYEIIVLPDRAKNKETRELATALGREVSCEEMLQTAKEYFGKYEKYLSSELSFMCRDMCWHQGVLSFNGNFSPQCKYFTEKQKEGSYTFDEYAIVNDSMHYSLDYHKVRNMKETLENRYCMENVKFQVGDVDNVLCVSGMSASLSCLLVNI